MIFRLTLEIDRTPRSLRHQITLWKGKCILSHNRWSSIRLSLKICLILMAVPLKSSKPLLIWQELINDHKQLLSHDSPNSSLSKMASRQINNMLGHNKEWGQASQCRTFIMPQISNNYLSLLDVQVQTTLLINHLTQEAVLQHLKNSIEIEPQLSRPTLIFLWANLFLSIFQSTKIISSSCIRSVTLWIDASKRRKRQAWTCSCQAFFLSTWSKKIYTTNCRRWRNKAMNNLIRSTNKKLVSARCRES